MKCAVLVTFLVSTCAALAVNPLITDDADPVGAGLLQIVTGWQFSRADSIDLNGYYLNPTIGITPRGEFGMTFGYRWRDGAPGANGIADTLLETKWRLLGNDKSSLKISARFDLKLPTASPRSGLGTGDPDADAILITTYSHGKTSLDWNIGYTKIDASRPVFNTDVWFLGQAVRQQLNGTWTLMGETCLTLPQGAAGPPANFDFDGGVQYSVRTNIQLSVLVGSAAGHDSPRLTSNFCLTWLFGLSRHP